MSNLSNNESHAVVADVGSFSTRIGFAGNDVPKAHFPSFVGTTHSPSTTKTKTSDSSSSSIKSHHFDIGNFREDMAIDHTVKDGLVCNWESYQQIWEHAILNSLKVDLGETPVLISEKSYLPSSDRAKIAELMFETFHVPHLFFSKDAVLGCYACGRTSGLVVDIGASGTVISPVVDGWVESKGVIRSIVGGRMMDTKVWDILSKKSLPQQTLLPLFRLQKKLTTSADNQPLLSVHPNDQLRHVHPSYDALMRLEMARQCKEAVCRVAGSPLSENQAKFSALPSALYELPDGTVISVGAERFEVLEMLYKPPDFESHSDDMIALGLQHSQDGAPPCKTQVGIPRLICDSTLLCDPDVQHTMTANIIVAGGGSAFEGLSERMQLEVEKIVHASAPTWKIRAVSPCVSERSLCTWLGGSILASLSSFNEMWVTRQEWNLEGALSLDKKCP